MKKQLDPNEKILVALPIHMLVTLWHVMNAGRGTRENFIDSYKVGMYNAPVFHEKEYSGTGDVSEGYLLIMEIFKNRLDIERLSEISYNKPVEVKLSDKYTATWNGGDTINVGCQEIPIEAIEKLLKEIKS